MGLRSPPCSSFTYLSQVELAGLIILGLHNEVQFPLRHSRALLHHLLLLWSGLLMQSYETMCSRMLWKEQCLRIRA